MNNSFKINAISSVKELKQENNKLNKYKNSSPLKIKKEIFLIERDIDILKDLKNCYSKTCNSKEIDKNLSPFLYFHFSFLEKVLWGEKINKKEVESFLVKLFESNDLVIDNQEELSVLVDFLKNIHNSLPNLIITKYIREDIDIDDIDNLDEDKIFETLQNILVKKTNSLLKEKQSKLSVLEQKLPYSDLKISSNEIFKCISSNIDLSIQSDPLYITLKGKSNKSEIENKLLNRSLTVEEYYRHLKIWDPVIDNPNTPIEVKDFLMNNRDENWNIDTQNEQYQYEMKRIDYEDILSEDKKKNTKKKTENKINSKKKSINNVDELDTNLFNELNTYFQDNNVTDKDKSKIIKQLKRHQKNQGKKYKKEENFNNMDEAFFAIINKYWFEEIIVENETENTTKEEVQNILDTPSGLQKEAWEQGKSLEEKNYIELWFLEGTIQKLIDLGYIFENQDEFEKQFVALTKGDGLFERNIEKFLSNNEDTSEKRPKFRKFSIQGWRILIKWENMNIIDGIYNHDDYEKRIINLWLQG